MISNKIIYQKKSFVPR